MNRASKNGNRATQKRNTSPGRPYWLRTVACCHTLPPKPQPINRSKSCLAVRLNDQMVRTDSGICRCVGTVCFLAGRLDDDDDDDMMQDTRFLTFLLSYFQKEVQFLTTILS